MSAKELLNEARSEASDELQRLQEEYWQLPPSEREFAAWAIRMAEQIENLTDAIDYMNHADELLED